MATVEELWDRIHTWLSEHTPSVDKDFCNGASEEELEKLEETVGLQLPEDFKTSYRIHNGHSSGAIFNNFEFQSVEEIISEWETKKFVLEQENFNAAFETDIKNPALKIQNKWWDPKWISFASNGCGDSIVIDMAPAESGTIGQVFEWFNEGGEFTWYAKNFTDYLKKFAEDLEAGKYKVYDDNDKSLEFIGDN